MYNLNEVVNFDAVYIFHMITNVLFPISIFCTMFYTYVIYKATENRKLKFIRICMMTCNFGIILMEALFIFCKPIRLFPLSVLYPVGYFSPMSSITCAAMVYLLGIVLIAVAFILLSILITRHFLIVAVINPNAKIHCGLLIGFVTACILTVDGIAFIELFSSIDDTLVVSILTTNIKDIQFLLDIQPSLFKVHYSSTSAPFFSILVFTIFFCYFLLLWLLYQNYKYPKNNLIVHSPTSQRRFKFIFKTTMVQYAIMAIFGTPAIAWFGILLMPPEFILAIKAVNWQLLHLSLWIVVPLYPISDCIGSILVISQYRKVAKRAIFAVLRSTILTARDFHSLVSRRTFAGVVVSITQH